MIPLALDLSSAAARLVVICAGILAVAGVVALIAKGVQYVRSRSNTAPVTDGTDDPPEVVIGHPGGSKSLDGFTEKRTLATVEPRYLIENKDTTAGVRDVTTGVRTRDGREHVFDSFYVGLLGSKESQVVENVGSIPAALLAGVHESAAFSDFLYWARFTRASTRWEVVYDPTTRRNSYQPIPMPAPRLNAVVRTGESMEVIVVSNDGNVRVDAIECVLPDDASKWVMLTTSMAAYPIPALEPGDSVSIPLVVTVGSAGALTARLRGRSEAVPYEREVTLSLI